MRRQRPRRLHVRLTLVPRGRVELVLAALRLAGLVPAADRSRDRGGLPSCHPARRGPIGALVAGQNICAYALGICGVLAATAIALPFILQSIALSKLDQWIDALPPQAAAVEA